MGRPTKRQRAARQRAAIRKQQAQASEQVSEQVSQAPAPASQLPTSQPASAPPASPIPEPNSAAAPDFDASQQTLEQQLDSELNDDTVQDSLAAAAEEDSLMHLVPQDVRMRDAFLAPPPVNSATAAIRGPTPANDDSSDESDDDDENSDASSVLSGRLLSPSPEPMQPDLVTPLSAAPAASPAPALQRRASSHASNVGENPEAVQVSLILAANKKRKSSSSVSPASGASAAGEKKAPPRKRVVVARPPAKKPVSEARFEVDPVKATMLYMLRTFAEKYHDGYVQRAAVSGDPTIPSVNQIQNTQAMLRSSPDLVAHWFAAIFGPDLAARVTLDAIRRHLAVEANFTNCGDQILENVCKPLNSQGSHALNNETRVSFPATHEAVKKHLAIAINKLMTAIRNENSLEVVSQVMKDIIDPDPSRGDLAAENFEICGVEFSVATFKKDPETGKREMHEAKVTPDSLRELLKFSTVQRTASRDVCSSFTVAQVVFTLADELLDQFVAGHEEIKPSPPPMRTSKKAKKAGAGGGAAAAVDPQVAAVMQAARAQVAAQAPAVPAVPALFTDEDL